MKIKLGGALLVLSVCGGSVLRAAPVSREGSSYDHYLRGLLLENEGNLMKAGQEYEKALWAEPASAYLHRAMANVSLRMGMVEQAAEEIEKAGVLSPFDHDAQILAGEIYFTKGDFSAARRHLEKALAINPQSDEALLNLAYLCSLKEPRTAVEYYRRYLLAHPDSPHIDERLALLYQQIGENDKAEEAWRRVLNGNRDSIKADLSLGQIHEVQGDTQTALGYYEKARVSSPHNLPLLLHLGQVYFKLNRSTEAAAAFLEAEKLAPDNLATHFWLALIGENQRDWAQAAAHMDRVSRALSEPGILLRLSYYYAQGGDMSASVRTLKRLRNLDPSNPDYIYYEAVGEETAGRLKAAAQRLNEFLAFRPKDAGAHFELGVVLDRRERFDEAVPHFLEAVQLRPDYDIAMNYLGYSWAEKGVHLKEAESLILRALRIDPTSAAYRDSLGWVYYQEGRNLEAERLLREAAAITQDALIEDHWGDALYRLGRKTEAFEAWETAMDAGGATLETERRGQVRELRRKIRLVSREIPETSRARVALRRAHQAWAGLRNFSGLARVFVERKNVPEARFAVQMDYRQGRLLKVEPLGPMGAAGFLSLENGRWINALSGFEGLNDDFRDVAVKIESLLSGELLNSFLKDSQLDVAVSDAEGIFSRSGLRMDLDMEEARVVHIRWGADAPTREGSVLALKYRRHEGPDFPNEISYVDPASGLKVKIVFDRVFLNEPEKSR
jgi:tetratricopeptide (TPR) repeat protein